MPTSIGRLRALMHRGLRRRVTPAARPSLTLAQALANVERMAATDRAITERTRAARAERFERNEWAANRALADVHERAGNRPESLDTGRLELEE